MALPCGWGFIPRFPGTLWKKEWFNVSSKVGYDGAGRQAIDVILITDVLCGVVEADAACTSYVASVFWRTINHSATARFVAEIAKGTALICYVRIDQQ